mmetsp:Transcript_16275/g.36605  ORF Transcript_16275/g.36605 Transcript_16275/m.36605 type:complete len:87 (-) Transcript_16275:38-298(-)
MYFWICLNEKIISDAGLARCERDQLKKKKKKVKVYDAVKFKNEKDFFDMFGIGYVPPNFRSCLGDEYLVHESKYDSDSDSDNDSVV